MTYRGSIVWGIVFPAAAFVGALVGIFLVRVETVQWKGDVTSGNALQAIATIAAAIAVSVFVQRAIQDRRQQNDLVCRQFDILLDLLAKFEDVAEARALSDVTADLKKISTKGRYIEECLKEEKYVDEIVKMADFTSAVRELRDKTTTTPVRDDTKKANSGNTPVSVTNGKVAWSNDRKQEIEEHVRTIQLRVFQLQMRIVKS